MLLFGYEQSLCELLKLKRLGPFIWFKVRVAVRSDVTLALGDSGSFFRDGGFRRTRSVNDPKQLGALQICEYPYFILLFFSLLSHIHWCTRGEGILIEGIVVWSLGRVLGSQESVGDSTFWTRTLINVWARRLTTFVQRQFEKKKKL